MNYKNNFVSKLKVRESKKGYGELFVVGEERGRESGRGLGRAGHCSTSWSMEAGAGAAGVLGAGGAGAGAGGGGGRPADGAGVVSGRVVGGEQWGWSGERGRSEAGGRLEWVSRVRGGREGGLGAM